MYIFYVSRKKYKSGEAKFFFSHFLNFFMDLREEKKAGPPWMATDPSVPWFSLSTTITGGCFLWRRRERKSG